MNLLVTGAWDCTEVELNELRNMGHEVIFMQWENDPLPCDYTWVEGVICNCLFLSHPIEGFTNLRFIQLTSAGFDRVPMDYIETHGIEIHNAKGVYSIPMAEFALCGVLQLYKQSRFFYDNQKQHKWEKHRGLLELYGKRVLIIGCGSVGTECAKRFQAFGCKVVGIDTIWKLEPNFTEILNIDALDEELALADIVALTLPLTTESKNLINKKRLALMKDSAILVNIARGVIVDETALIKALENKTIGGAVLDVFEEEPLSEDYPLWDMKNVVIKPHSAFVGEGNKERLNTCILRQLEEKRE